MPNENETPLDHLWLDYGRFFQDFDDLTLARWMAQTLGQLRGRVWRYSHPLVGSYRLAAQAGNQRQIWLKRLASPPAEYLEAGCCRAPLLPLLTRDVLESGLICLHCGGTAVPLEDLPAQTQTHLRKWADKYAEAHDIAHWDERQRKRAGDYDRVYEDAARSAETLLAKAASEIAPTLLDHYAAIVWEDQDECLEVRPEDIPF